MKVGYFKLPPTPSRKGLTSPSRKLLAPPKSGLFLLPSVSRKSLPVVGFFLALVLITSMQSGYIIGQSLNLDISVDPSFASADNYRLLAQISWPDNLSFVASWFSDLVDLFYWLRDLVVDWFDLIKERWLGFLGLSVAPPAPESTSLDEEKLRAEIRNQVLAELAQRAPLTDKASAVSINGVDYNLSVSPSNLRVPAVFSDPVWVQLNLDGLSGKIIPRFRGPNDPAEYLFILSPAKGT